MVDIALPQVVPHVFFMGMRAFQEGRARTDHPFNRGATAITTWQHGHDAAATASGVKPQHAPAGQRRVELAQGVA